MLLLGRVGTLATIDSRIVIGSVSGLIILIFYFYITSNNYYPRSSDIHPPSGSPLASDFMSQVNCSSNDSTGALKERANCAVKEGIALEQLGRFQEAIKFYEKALRLGPTNSDLIVRNGDALTRVKNYSGAIIYYEIVLARYPNSKGSMGLIEGIGDNLYHMGKYTEAIGYYNKALAREPNNVQVQQDKERALKALERSTSNGVK